MPPANRWKSSSKWSGRCRTGTLRRLWALFGKLGMSPLLERKRSEERSLAAALIVSRLLDPGSKLALSRQLSRETATSTLGERLAVCMNPALREERALDGLCVYGFNTLLSELATLCRVTIRPDIKNADAFFKLTEPTGYVPPSLRGIPGPLRCTR